MTGHVLLYGATGFTAQKILEEIAGTMPLVIAGRDAERVAEVADRFHLPWCAFDLSDHATIVDALDGASVVLNAAGPYLDTAIRMADACIEAGCHYLDLAGEWPVFGQLLAHDEAAREAGVMLLPGMGLTIAASDCLLKRAVETWPDTVKFYIGFSCLHAVSAGSVASAARVFDADLVVRRDGELVPVPAGSLVRAFDFAGRLSEATAMTWADVVTCELSTGVRSIETFTEQPWWHRSSYRMAGLTARVTGAGPWRSLGAATSKIWPEEPPGGLPEGTGYTLVVEAHDRWRRPRVIRMHVLDGYSASALTSAEALHRIRDGQVQPGFQTPSLVFGSDFIVQAGAAEFVATPREATV
ncbi:saccharopine dehydrogenase family protein [Tsuneonella mangrovi]|uniref:saccharopine dehydrogenase family protein n=1 Tax=Tsuneonella mangrovi TaxID=1982042 RepID=UPI0014715CF0|nr:saccharopine dehydrogenase NADP-binding domain-containing protein [Tsuneonella mangrovi]